MAEQITCPHCTKQFPVPYRCYRTACAWTGSEAKMQESRVGNLVSKLHVCPRCGSGVGVDWETLGCGGASPVPQLITIEPKPVRTKARKTRLQPLESTRKAD